MAALDYPPPADVLRPFKHTEKLLLGPGPSNCSERVLQAASLQVNGIVAALELATIGRDSRRMAPGLPDNNEIRAGYIRH